MKTKDQIIKDQESIGNIQITRELKKIEEDYFWHKDCTLKECEEKRFLKNRIKELKKAIKEAERQGFWNTDGVSHKVSE